MAIIQRQAPEEVARLEAKVPARPLPSPMLVMDTTTPSGALSCAFLTQAGAGEENVGPLRPVSARKEAPARPGLPTLATGMASAFLVGPLGGVRKDAPTKATVIPAAAAIGAEKIPKRCEGKALPRGSMDREEAMADPLVAETATLAVVSATPR